MGTRLDTIRAIIKVSDMKTTLMIDDVILKKAKEQAAARDTTVSELVNQSLRAYLHSPKSGGNPVVSFSMPTFGHAGNSVGGVTTEQIAELRDDGR